MLVIDFQVTKPLSEVLQKKSQNLCTAMEDVNVCVTVLKAYRNDQTFYDLFKEATKINGAEIPMPRRVGRQKHKNNAPADNASEYYKRNVFLPFIDTVISQLETRFSEHSKKAFSLYSLLPKYCVKVNFSAVRDAFANYIHFVPGAMLALEAEFQRWKAYWLCQPESDRISDALDTLCRARDLGTYPGITILLHIFITLPVTTATGERSFSSLKFIKSYLRSTMGEERLNGLAHLFINRDIELNYSQVIDEFSKGNRRLDFNQA